MHLAVHSYTLISFHLNYLSTVQLFIILIDLLFPFTLSQEQEALLLPCVSFFSLYLLHCTNVVLLYCTLF